MADTITCISILATTPTGEQLYFELDNKPFFLQVKPNGHRIKKPKDDQPSYWYTATNTGFTADSTLISADSTIYTADAETGALELHPSFYDREVNDGFHTREYWTTVYQRLEFFGSVDEVRRQIQIMFALINS